MITLDGPIIQGIRYMSFIYSPNVIIHLVGGLIDEELINRDFQVKKGDGLIVEVGLLTREYGT